MHLHNHLKWRNQWGDLAVQCLFFRIFQNSDTIGNSTVSRISQGCRVIYLFFGGVLFAGRLETHGVRKYQSGCSVFVVRRWNNNNHCFSWTAFLKVGIKFNNFTALWVMLFFPTALCLGLNSFQSYKCRLTILRNKGLRSSWGFSFLAFLINRCCSLLHFIPLWIPRLPLSPRLLIFIRRHLKAAAAFVPSNQRFSLTMGNNKERKEGSHL